MRTNEVQDQEPLSLFQILGSFITAQLVDESLADTSCLNVTAGYATTKAHQVQHAATAVHQDRDQRRNLARPLGYGHIRCHAR